jgi:hypothetical protein
MTLPNRLPPGPRPASQAASEHANQRISMPTRDGSRRVDLRAHGLRQPGPGGRHAGRSRPAAPRPPPVSPAGSGPYPTAIAAGSCRELMTPAACAARSAARSAPGGSGRSYRSLTRTRSRRAVSPITTMLASGLKPSRCEMTASSSAGEPARTAMLGCAAREFAGVCRGTGVRGCLRGTGVRGCLRGIVTRCDGLSHSASVQPHRYA